MVTYHVVSEEDWEQVPAGKPGKESQWKPVLDEVASGKIVSIPVTSSKELKGFRIGLARTAGGQGMKLEFRATDTILAVRKSSEPVVPRAKAERKPRASRKKSTPEGEA